MIRMVRILAVVFLVCGLASCMPVVVQKPATGVIQRDTETKLEAVSETPEVEPRNGETETVTVEKSTNGNGDEEKNGEKASEQETMDAALDLVAQSKNLWESGDLDGALGLLDQAYSLILETDGDPDISWQRDDLRYIISKRILEIYTSRTSAATGIRSEIPLDMNRDIEKEIKRFQTGDSRFFVSSYVRSGRYRPMIVRELKKAGIPEELSWLPLVESGFKIKALSKARALGLWQFIPSTGYKFGLKRNHWIDERMDVEKSTAAAIEYLKELHGIFGDWMTVLAAYNCGEGRVLRVISRQHMNYLDNFWDLYRQLPYETARYVPKFLAVLHIIRDPEKYGMRLDVVQDKEIPYETVKVNKCMKLKDVARYLDLSEEVMSVLNPELRYKTTPDVDYDLKIPAYSLDKFGEIYARIPKSKKPGGAEYVRHRVRHGESLSVIAERYKSSIRAIVSANRLRSRNRITAGKWLKIPVRSGRYTQKKRPAYSSTGKITSGGVSSYRVQKGDSLWILARRFDTTVSKIKQDNKLRGNLLSVGQSLRMGNPEASEDGKGEDSYRVRRGDSLFLIASKTGVSLNKIMNLNKLSRRSKIYPGQMIRLK